MSAPGLGERVAVGRVRRAGAYCEASTAQGSPFARPSGHARRSSFPELVAAMRVAQMWGRGAAVRVPLSGGRRPPLQRHCRYGSKPRRAAATHSPAMDRAGDPWPRSPRPGRFGELERVRALARDVRTLEALGPASVVKLQRSGGLGVVHQRNRWRRRHACQAGPCHCGSGSRSEHLMPRCSRTWPCSCSRCLSRHCLCNVLIGLTWCREDRRAWENAPNTER